MDEGPRLEDLPLLGLLEAGLSNRHRNAEPQGLDFYYRMVDTLLAAGIQPFCTLYHWDLPQTLQDKGGWENRDTAKAFADYAGYTAGKLSDRVQHFMTMNEMRTFVEQGYGLGVHAPGLRLDTQRLAQLTHYILLGHGLGMQAIRAQVRPGTKVGIADNITPPVPVVESPEHIAAARKAMREENAMFLTAIKEGRYTDLYPQAPGNRRSQIHGGRTCDHCHAHGFRRYQYLSAELHPR
jgi:beta-glucosidase